MKNHELEQLFLQFRDAGDMRALARLFDAAAPQLLPVAVHLAARRDEADDLIQATFLTAIERAETYERGRAVLPWLLGILALHARKLRQKQGRILELDRVRQPPEHDPEQQAASSEVRQAVDAACRSLPAAYATIVQRHLVEGLEPLELAGEMGISNGAARVRLHRGMKLLRRALPPAFSSGAYAATSTRGVAAIREAVLERASMLTGSPIPAAGFAPLGLLLTFLLPFAIALPAWFAWHEHDGSAPEESVLPVTSSPTATSSEVALAGSTPLEIERVESANAPESELIVNESNARSSSNATVRGRLLLAGGVPAVGASVKLTGWSGSDDRAREFGLPVDWHDPETQAASDGRFEFSFDPPRAFCFKLKVDHASAAKAEWYWFEVKPSGTIDLGDIALEPAGTIVAHIVDAQSNPMSTGWTVDVEAPAPTAAQGRMATAIHQKWVEGSQDFVIERVPARRVTIKARTEMVGRIQPLVAEVAAGQTKQVELRYSGPDLSRRITVMTSTAPFYMWYDAGVFQISATRQGAAPIAGSYDQGGVMAYLIDGCDPGSYDVTVSDPHFVPWSKSNVQPGELVRAKLVGNAALQLHLAGPDGAPYSGPYGLRGRFAKSNPFPTASNEVVLVDVAAAPPAGNLITGVIPANYELTLEIPGQPAQKISLVGMAPNQTRDVQCGPPTSLTLHGHVIASDGSTPVSGVDVQLTHGDLPGHTFGSGAMIVFGPNGIVPGVNARATTDAQGEFVFSGLSAGQWTLRAAWGTYLRADRTIDLGAQSEPVVIQQPASGFLSGHLLVPAGAPLEDTFLLLKIATQDLPHQPLQADREHDELQSDGSFRFGPLPAGEVSLELQVMTTVPTANGASGWGSGIGTIHTATIHDGEEVEAEIDLRETFPGRLAVSVALDDQAASGGWVKWSREGSPQIFSDEMGGREVSLDGTARLGALKPGTLRITYVSEDKTWAWSVPQPIVIAAGQEGSYALALHTTERDLRCVDLQGGAVLANVEIEWRSGIGGEVLVAKARTDGAGLLHLRMPDQQIELRCVGDSGAFTAVSWGPGTGPLNVSLRRAP